MRGRNKHLTKEHRFYIEKSLKKGISVSDIAKDLGYSRQAIYNEIKKGSYENIDSKTWKTTIEYGYDVGQRVHDEKSRNKGRKIKLSSDDKYLSLISGYIKNKYSPYAAQKLLGINKCCVKTIYNYIYKGHMSNISVNNLPYSRFHKRKEKSSAKTMPKGTSINDRPQIVENRDTYGHWEMDTVMSSKDDRTCLLVLSERMTRDELIYKIKDRTTESVIKEINRIERKIGTPAFRQIFKTITCDNGVEFSGWESIQKSCRTKGYRTNVYFCHPYSAYERGTNENINRMIRRHIPKGDDIGLYSDCEIKKIQKWINTYPRSIFDGMSSDQYMELFLSENLLHKIRQL